MESNDSPEIPDRGETSDIPGLPSGGALEEDGGDKRLGQLEFVCKADGVAPPDPV